MITVTVEYVVYKLVDLPGETEKAVRKDSFKK